VNPRVIHSLHHKAQDRHHAAGCPTDVRHELFGHEKKTVAAGYGVRHPVPLFKSGLMRSAFRLERQHLRPSQRLADNDLTGRINAVNLKNLLAKSRPMVVIFMTVAPRL
jgi:hypothetical protein